MLSRIPSSAGWGLGEPPNPHPRLMEKPRWTQGARPLIHGGGTALATKPQVPGKVLGMGQH